jgi:hypothetical protein
VQESCETELWIKRYGLWKLSGVKWSFKEVLGAILEFLEWLEGLGAKDMALVNFGDFQGFLWNFGGSRVVYDLFVNIF